MGELHLCTVIDWTMKGWERGEAYSLICCCAPPIIALT